MADLMSYLRHYRAHLAVILGNAAFAAIFLTIVLSGFHQPTPHQLPVGVVAPAPVARTLERRLDARLPGAFDLRPVASAARARSELSRGDIDGAVVVEPQRIDLLTAEAGGTAPTQAITGAVTALASKVPATGAGHRCRAAVTGRLAGPVLVLPAPLHAHPQHGHRHRRRPRVAPRPAGPAGWRPGRGGRHRRPGRGGDRRRHQRSGALLGARGDRRPVLAGDLGTDGGPGAHQTPPGGSVRPRLPGLRHPRQRRPSGPGRVRPRVPAVT